MELTLVKLQQILSEAFDGGYDNNNKDEFVAELFNKYKITDKDDQPPSKIDDDYRIYLISELATIPENTVFNHFTLGKCRIKVRYGNKYMAFDNPGLAPSGFNVDGYPWDIPMKRIS